MRTTSRRRILTPFVAMAAVAGGIAVAPGPAAAAVPGHVVITVNSAVDSNDFKTVTATCPTGMVAIGGGFITNNTVSSDDAEIVVDDFRPNGNATTAPTAVTVGAYEADGTANNWQISAQAVCANVGGVVRVSAISVTDSNDTHDAQAACPAGKVMTGTGYQIDGATGEAIIDDFALNGSETTAPTVLDVRAQEADDFAGNWNVTAYGICANPLPGLSMLSINSAFNTITPKALVRDCPVGMVLTGIGFFLSGSLGEAMITDLAPVGGGGSVVVGYEEDPFSGSWAFRSQLICATA